MCACPVRVCLRAYVFVGVWVRVVCVFVCACVPGSARAAPTGLLNITGQGFEPCRSLVPDGHSSRQAKLTAKEPSWRFQWAQRTAGHRVNLRLVWHLTRPSVLCTAGVFIGCLVKIRIKTMTQMMMMMMTMLMIFN